MLLLNDNIIAKKEQNEDLKSYAYLFRDKNDYLILFKI